MADMVEDLLQEIQERCMNFKVQFFVRTKDGEQHVATFMYYCKCEGIPPHLVPAMVCAPNFLELLRKVKYHLDENDGLNDRQPEEE